MYKYPYIYIFPPIHIDTFVYEYLCGYIMDIEKYI